MHLYLEKACLPNQKSICSWFYMPLPKSYNISPIKRPFKGKLIFQPWIFKGYAWKTWMFWGRKFHQDVAKVNSIKKTTDYTVNQSFDNPKSLYVTLDTNSPILEGKKGVGDRVSFRKWLTWGLRNIILIRLLCVTRCRRNFAKGSTANLNLARTPLKTGCLSLLPNLIFFRKRLLVVFLSHHFSIKLIVVKTKSTRLCSPFPPEFHGENLKINQQKKNYIYIIPQEMKAPLARITDAKKIWGKTSSWNFFSPQAPQYFWSPIASRSVEGGVIAKDVAKHTPKEPKVEHT